MSITDGTFVCALCGEWLTGCALCGDAPLLDMRDTIRREREARAAAEREERDQERAIRQASEHGLR